MFRPDRRVANGNIGSTKLSKSVSQFAFNFEMTVILNNDLKHEKGKCEYIRLKLKLSEPKKRRNKNEKNNYYTLSICVFNICGKVNFSDVLS